jgi:hypothetical protein
MSQPTIIAELVAEERRLQLKLDKIRELRILYESDGTESVPSGISEPRERAALHQSQRPHGAMTTGSNDLILDAAADLTRGRTDPTPTTEILQHLQSIGVYVGGKVPRNNLSSKLSHSDRFHAHGRAGWTLVEAEGVPDETSHEAPDDDAAEGDTSGASFEAGVGLSGGLNGVNAP